MFTTPDEVMAVTPYTDVTTAQVMQAQFVIEVHVGRVESEITDSRDKEMLARAVIAQCVYMRDNPDVTFEQIAAQSISRGDGQTVFKAGDDAAPFIAPLALMACKHLSWKKSRSIAVGKTIGRAERARILYWMSVWGALSPYGLSYGMDGTSPSDYGMAVPFDPETWDEV
jgi:hypothetical protein